MRASIELLRYERRARVFLLALLQSGLGTGAGYVALLLVAEDRFASPWAISLVLIADLVPAMLLGPVFGAAADRWSRKRCAIVADVLRVAAFAGIAAIDSFAATLAFAGLAGVGTGLFRPATLAALPSVVDDPRRTPAATSLYGAVDDLGYIAGPAVAAPVLLFGGPETLVLFNACTFAISALLLVPLRFGAAPAQRVELPPASLLADARDGLRATAGMRGIRIVLLASSAVLFCAGLFNIAELFFARDHLGTTDAGFAVLVALFGGGFICGSLAGARGGDGPSLKRRYLLGMVVFGGGFAAIGVTGSLAVGLVTFAVAGFGNGLVLVYERLLILATVDDSLAGRVFGIKDTLSAWAFGVAFVAAGAALELLSARELILIAGGVGVVAFAISAVALRGEWTAPGPPDSGGDLPLAGAAARARPAPGSIAPPGVG
jgi:MFS family permease